MERHIDRIQALVTEIQQYCAAHANPAGLAKFAKYFKEGFDAWGLLDKNDELWIAKKQEWLDGYSDLDIPAVIRAGELLFASGKYEEGNLAILFLTARRDQLRQNTAAQIGRWFDAGLRNWAHTDVLCGEVLSPLLAENKLTSKFLAPWRKSKMKFQRRAVPVALIGPVKAGHEIAPLLDFVEPLMLDEERVVHQGQGWFLREAWKKQPKPVEALLLRYKDTAARLIFQYATEKMSPPQKARFKKSK